MPRQPRYTFPGAWFHVFNRGARRQAVFADDKDRSAYINQLATLEERHGVEVHAYCLMGNHYHLLLFDPLGERLAPAMQGLIGRYTQHFNRRHTLDGALFRGRYAAVLLDSDQYLLTVSRYIHRNPVDAYLARSPTQFEWSSARAFVNPGARPSWLHVNPTLEIAGGESRYRELIETRSPDDDELDDFYRRSDLPPVLGSAPFKDRLGSGDFDDAA